MTRIAIDELLYVLEEAYRGPGVEHTYESQSLLPNLATVRDEDWSRIPAGGRRSIAAIVVHVGACKVMYDDYAFGPGKLTWESSEVEPWPGGAAPRDEVGPWLESAHQRLREHIAALEDEDLARTRLTNWGEQRETRWIVSVMIQHDLYHAGEVNHIRSLFAGDDRWQFQVDLGLEG